MLNKSYFQLPQIWPQGSHSFWSTFTQCIWEEQKG